jgi:hypothetical protein
VLLVALLPAAAQDGFDPSNPPEPYVSYQLTVSCQPAEAATVSGGGKYRQGTTVTVKATAKTNYTFQYWTLNGERIEETKVQFKYTTRNQDDVLVAVYEYTPPQTPPFDPSNPAEPTVITKPDKPDEPTTYKLYLRVEPEDGGTINRESGMASEAGTEISLKATPKENFRFDGWYDGDELLSETVTYTYTMQEQDATLVARFIYDPSGPSEPNANGDQGNVQNELSKYDLNQDGKETAADIVIIVNYMAGVPDEGITLERVDLNGDHVVNTADILTFLNYFWKTK